jgi:hypothetical protein
LVTGLATLVGDGLADGARTATGGVGIDARIASGSVKFAVNLAGSAPIAPPGEAAPAAGCSFESAAWLRK